MWGFSGCQSPGKCLKNKRPFNTYLIAALGMKWSRAYWSLGVEEGMVSEVDIHDFVKTEKIISFCLASILCNYNFTFRIYDT